MPNIIRVSHNKENPYMMVSKETVNYKGLDFQSLGLLMVLLSKPDTWRIRPERLAEERGISTPCIHRGLNKLIEAGYVVRDDIRIRQPNGQFKRAVQYTVFEDKAQAVRTTPYETMSNSISNKGQDVKIEGLSVPF